MADFQPVVFKLNDSYYGLDISKVNAIERRHSVIGVPNSSQSIKGIINLRGEIIAVVNLKAKFNLPITPGETELIVVNLDRYKIALEVDRVEEIHNVSGESIVDMPIIAKGKGVTYFDKIAKSGDKIIILINPEQLLTDEEQQAVEKLTADSEE